MNLRDLPVYQRHLDAMEPEKHSIISIEYAIRVLEDMRKDIVYGGSTWRKL